MPQRGERVFPVPVTPEADKHLAEIVKRSGLRPTDILRYANIAALRALAKEDYVAFPIELEVQNGKKK